MSVMQLPPQPIAGRSALWPADVGRMVVAAAGLFALLPHLVAVAHAQERQASVGGWSTIVGLADRAAKPAVAAHLPRLQNARHVRRLAKSSNKSVVQLVTSSLPEKRVPLIERSGSDPEDRPVGAAAAKSAEAPAPAWAPAPVAVAAPAPQFKPDTAGADYCRNLMPVVAEARAAFLQSTIASLEQEMARKTAQLETRITEHKEWIDKRQRLAALADSKLLGMYAVMRPDAAGQRFAAMDELLAASLLMKLDARVSSALLSEVAPEKAARLTAIIAAAAGVKPPQTQPAPAQQSDRLEAGKK